MKKGRRLAARKTRRGSWGALGLSVLAVCACNALSGVNDLEFGDPPPPPPEAGDPPAPDGQMQAINPLAGACNALTGGGCPADQTCRFSRSAGAASCAPVPASPLEAYAACRDDAECPAAHLCVAGVCSRLCESAADCGWSNARCVADPGGQFRRCTRNCDLLTRAEPRSGLQACGAGVRCDFVPESDGSGYTDCVIGTGGSFDGAACESDGACPVGFICQKGRCAAACDPGGAACPGGGTCNDPVSRAGQIVGGCCTIPPGQTCNLLTDCGCSAGQTCSVPDETGATTCRTLGAAPVGSYASCSFDGDCPSGHSCIGSSCKRHCRSLADCGDQGTACLSVLRDTLPIPGFSFCARGCDLLDPARADGEFRACGAQANCFLASGYTDCIGGGSGVQNASCEGSEDCAPGYICYRGSCERWCDPNDSVCEAGTFCGGLVDVDGRSLGSCCRPPTGQVCDWVTDCGCSASETCARDAAGVRFCRAVAATTVAPYAGCGNDSECPRGYSCVAGNCMQRCSASADCGTNIQCVSLAAADAVETQLTGVCSRNCDVLSPAAPAAGFQPCAAGLTCTDLNGLEGGASVCTVPGAGGVGDACASFADCGTGMDCDQGQCLQLCALGSSCDDGEDCRLRAIDIGAVNGRVIGVCPLGD